MTSVRVAIRGVQRSGQRPAMLACARGNSLCSSPSPHPKAGGELAKLVALEQERVGITEDKSKPTPFSHRDGLAHGPIQPIVDGMTEGHAILADVSASPEEKHPVLASYASLPCPPFVHNERQLDVVTTLSRIYDATVSDWQSGEIRRAKPRRPPAPKAAPSKGLFGGLFSRKEEKKVTTPKKVEAYTPPEYLAPKGAYIVGSSGSGKTSLLNVFFRSLPREFPVVRLHWHEFCRDGFRYMHEATKTSREKKGPGCFELMANDIAGRCRVFLLDELNITSISEGVLVKELFRQLWVRGVTVITTSNYKINELYYQGFNRSSLEDFFPELAERVPELDMSMDVDLRTVGIIDSGTFLIGLDEENKKTAHEKFLTAAGEGIQHDVELPVPLESRPIHAHGDAVLQVRDHGALVAGAPRLRQGDPPVDFFSGGAVDRYQ